MNDTATRRIEVNGHQLAWGEWGAASGVPLVLCHGFSGSSYDFAVHVEGLAASRRVIAFDHLGHGMSQKTGSVADYSLDVLVDDAIAVIEAVGGGPVDLLGHSLGGRVVVDVAVRRPDLVRSLVLMDTTAWSFKPTDENLQAMIRQIFDEYDPAQGPLQMDFPGPEQDMMAATTPADWQARKTQLQAGTDPYALKALSMQLFVTDMPSRRADLPGITCPTTVLVGEFDAYLAEQAPELAAELANGRLCVIGGAHHSPQLTHPEEWRATIEAHLAWANG